MLKKISIFIIYLLYHSLSLAQSGLIINEVFYNPNNSTLSSYEYIELYNNSASSINLTQYTIQINSNNLKLEEIRIAPKQYIIITSAEARNELERYGNICTAERWFALSNTSATVRVKKDEVIIDEVTYQNNWHNSTTQRNGGFSLERINPNWMCNTQQNWATSANPMGSTPGKMNAVYNDKLNPILEISSFEIKNKQVTLFLNTSLNLIENIKKDNFELSDNQNKTIEVHADASKHTLTLTFEQDLSNQKTYSLLIKNLQICNLPIQPLSLTLFKQYEVAHNDILINEILFNPKVGGVDFLELYNRTNNPINLQYWKIGNRTITQDLLLIEPLDFIVLTTNKNILTTQYPNAIANNIFQVSSLPSFPNQQGYATLISNLNTLVDSLYYNAKMHYPLMVNEKGISLERQSYLAETNSIGNFKSASTIVGGATPGYQNSSNVENFIKKNNIFLTSKILSPNNDFHEDFLEINYELISPDYMMNATIFDEKGRVINRLIRQQKVGDKGKITWDGKGENGTESTAGHYILKVELFSSNGDKFNFKTAFVLTYNTLSY